MIGDDDHLSDDEIARRRDAVVRRMANTPPRPRSTAPRHQGKKKKAEPTRAARKNRADRED